MPPTPPSSGAVVDDLHRTVENLTASLEAVSQADAARASREQTMSLLMAHLRDAAEAKRRHAAQVEESRRQRPEVATMTHPTWSSTAATATDRQSVCDATHNATTLVAPTVSVGVQRSCDTTEVACHAALGSAVEDELKQCRLWLRGVTEQLQQQVKLLHAQQERNRIMSEELAASKALIAQLQQQHAVDVTSASDGRSDVYPTGFVDPTLDRHRSAGALRGGQETAVASPPGMRRIATASTRGSMGHGSPPQHSTVQPPLSLASAGSSFQRSLRK
jgi:hypothetical protein